MLAARVGVRAERLEQGALVEGPEIDVILNRRDPLLGDVLGSIPGLLPALGFDGVGVGLLDFEHRVAERQPLERPRLLELRLRLVDARCLGQKIETPANPEREIIVEVVPVVGRPHVLLRQGDRRGHEVRPEAEPEIREELRAVVGYERLARDDAGARHVHVRPEDAGSLEILRDRDEAADRASSRGSSGTSKLVCTPVMKRSAATA